LGLDSNQLIGIITHAENLYNQQQKVQDNSKIRIIQAEVVAHSTRDCRSDSPDQAYTYTIFPHFKC